MPTLTFRAKRLTLTMGASAEKYMSVTLESTMPVAGVFWILCNIVSMVGLKLAL